VKLGIVATEAPPQIGGMQEYASQLAAHLSHSVDVTCLVGVDSHLDVDGGRCRAVLTSDLTYDLGYLKDLDVDVLLGLNAGFAAAASRLRRPLAVTVNGNDFLHPWIGLSHPADSWISKMPLLWRWATNIRDARWRRQLRSGLRRCAAVIAISRAAKQRVIEAYGLRDSQVHVVHPGVNESFFDITDGRRGRSRLELLTVARLTQQAARKNIEGVLGAIEQLRCQIPIHYTIVGDGDDKERLMSISRQMGLADDVTFAGAVSHDELKRLYSESDLFVMVPKSSARDVEGFGIVYIEASAAGVPVLASRSGGSLDAVTEGENGWLVEDSTPEGIARSVRAAIPRLGPEMSARARAHAEHFRWSLVAARIRSILESAGAPASGVD
jgi:glycosyltransferase involved in cell wall biosynthesis